MKKLFINSILLIMAGTGVSAQDPHFSQFFVAPLQINPAAAGTGIGDWRLMSNYRQQWNNAGTPFTTMSASGEMKILGKEKGENILGGGLTLMSDQSMNGAFKSIYASGSIAGHVQMGNSRLGAGFDVSYGNRRLDYSQLTFGEQFTSGGFDVSLPTGETGLANMKPFVSVGAGILYNFRLEKFNLEIGAGGFHLNKPRQTFIKDAKEILPPRYTAQLSMELDVSDQVMLNMNSVFQQQATQKYFSVGGTVGLDISNGDRRSILFAGGWYRNKDAIYPYLGLLFGVMQFGFSYDVTNSLQNKGPSDIPQSFEISIVLRQARPLKGELPCPGR